MEWIDPYIRTLEGKLLRTEDLLAVQARQDNIWGPDGGYVNIVTDLRNHEYWRAYPGRSKEPLERIKVHNRQILRGSVSTLHYYIISQGQGHRKANWLKLWQVPEGLQVSSTFRAVALNVLEMTMCRAFQSLPGDILETYYGPNEDGRPYSNLGLNIIPPVLQGLSLGPSARKSFSLGLEISPDSDIKGWPKFRYDYGKKVERTEIHFQRPLMQSSEFHTHFQVATQHLQLSESFCGDKPLPYSTLNNSELVHLLERDLDPTDCLWAYPNGNFKALVGFVLEDCLDAEPTNSSIMKISIPRQFQDSGWNTANSLTWAANPLQRDLTRMTRCLQSTQQPEVTSFIRFNQTIIQHSGLRVVLMCGRSVQNLVLPTRCEETRLKLEAGDFPMFLDIEDGAIKRIYVLTPNPTDAFLLRDWRKTHRLSEIIHFISAITKTIGIRPYAGDNGCVLTKAIRNYMDEQKGIKELLTIQTLHPMTRLWLTRRGFATDEDISLLQERAGGSLAHAILVLLHVPPCHIQKASTISSMSLFHKSKEYHPPKFRIDKAQLEAVRELCDKVGGEHPVDSDHPSDDLIQDITHKEEELGTDIGQADVLEREDLEASRVCVDDHGTLALAIETPVIPWERRNTRPTAGGRSYTIGDGTREELLRGRKYLGNGTRKQGFLGLTIHSCIEIPFRTKEPQEEVIVKAEIKPPGQRHPNAWAKKALTTDPGSRLAFCISYKMGTAETSSYVTSNLDRNLYKANSFVHWMEGEDVAQIITRPRQFVVVSSLTKTLPRGIPEPGSFYTDDHATLFPAKEFELCKKRKTDEV
ncbi:uncharacterized protein N7459_003034 [Penicillium hispanicum]|uniref:uncharacterized protein n=1 Tax=Penicillium hispanicum TaxID=1080232 RepID=UPI00253F94B6|nr:uncharacterized protein N7459_003034 [Penicillium hispanicum]KAJ5587269.1 hypothetical protein N7459_003034 [Penicillium hispanicum]